MDPRLISLHTHWCIADSIRVVMPVEIPEQHVDVGLSEEVAQIGHLASSFSRMVVWYSLLYVVVEGYRELGLDWPEVNELLQEEDHVDNLRLFRNSTFHYQKNPIPEKAMKFLLAEDSEKWIRKLSSAFANSFLENLPIREHMDAFRDAST